MPRTTASSQQNDIAHIASLPPELLAEIFVRCVPASSSQVHGDVSWLNITRVSRVWRSVALACPSFWSTLVLSRPKWTPILLEKSKMASLVIRVDLGQTRHASLESILRDNAARLGTLEVRSPNHHLASLVYGLDSAHPAPRLQDVKIINTTARDSGLWLPPNLFRRSEVARSRKAGEGSVLALHLVRCAFQWDSPWYTHLTHLHLEDIRPPQRPTMESLLVTLVGSPNLESLAIIYCDPITLDGFIVNLSRLSSLTVKSTGSFMCSRLLDYITIPPSATLYVSSYIDPLLDDPSKEVSKLQLWVKPIAPSDALLSTCDTLRITYKNGVTWTVHDSNRPWWSRKFELHAMAWPHNILWAMQVVDARLDTTNITTLHLQGIVRGQEVITMGSVLGRGLPCVRTLHLYSAFPSRWLEFMLTHAMYLIGVTHFRDFECGGPIVHAWPALRCLGLHEINLGESVEQLWPSSADLLYALFFARREGGARICELEIEGCANVFAQDLQQLRLFVDVMYDGKGEETVLKDVGYASPRVYSLGILDRMIEHWDQSSNHPPKLT
ncbi:hypothetical protein B0H11DRAFT_1974202 [Mycena galericulata]|nr:hypothetical protein B0H11DRAFT_1974202 [Mycena galericulata]